MGKRKAPESGGNVADAIMGDLMCQMLTFFILLYTVAAVNTTKVEAQDANIVEQIKEGFRKRLKLSDEAMPKEPVVQVTEAKVEELDVAVKSQIITKIKDIVEKETFNKYIEVIVEEQRIRLIFNQPVLFNSGYAYLKPGAGNYLDPVITDILSNIGNDIIIEGHTDDKPIKNDKYRDNWQLSFDRAYTVLKYMVDKHGIDPRRVSAIGYGEYRPRVGNDTEENRGINRRIEVNILLHAKKVDANKP